MWVFNGLNNLIFIWKTRVVYCFYFQNIKDESWPTLCAREIFELDVETLCVLEGKGRELLSSLRSCLNQKNNSLFSLNPLLNPNLTENSQWSPGFSSNSSGYNVVSDNLYSPMEEAEILQGWLASQSLIKNKVMGKSRHNIQAEKADMRT